MNAAYGSFANGSPSDGNSIPWVPRKLAPTFDIDSLSRRVNRRTSSVMPLFVRFIDGQAAFRAS